MKTFKKALALVLIVAVALTAGVMGTLAYLTSEDSDVNVMTMGFVSIKQHEYERAVNADGSFATATIDERTSYVLQSFTQGKPLLPIVGDPSLPGNHPGYAGYDSIPVRMTQVDSYGGMDVFAGKNAQDRLRGNRLTGAGLANDGQRFALGQIEVDASNCLHLTVRSAEGDGQISDLQFIFHN